MCDNYEKVEKWLKSIYSINREIDFERENINYSEERIKELEKKKEDIFQIIRSVSNPLHKQILHKRYVQGKKWEDISEELAYELQHIHRLHKKAIYAVCDLKKDIH